MVVALERLAVDDDDRITVEDAIAESLAEMERGETFELTDAFFMRARERAIENSRRGYRVSDDITWFVSPEVAR